MAKPQVITTDATAGMESGLSMRDYAGRTGVAWAERNPSTVVALDGLYIRRCGRSRTQLNRDFLDDIPRTARILEVGSSLGVQLAALYGLGFHDLWGVDINRTVLARSKWPGAAVDLFDLPFEDEAFDLVFTSGVLMHVPPDQKNAAMRELARCSRYWVFGYEIWAVGMEKSTWASLPPGWAEDTPRIFPKVVPGWRRKNDVIMFGKPDAGQPHHCMYLMEKMTNG